MIGKERFEFLAQLGISGRNLVKIRTALLRCQIQNCDARAALANRYRKLGEFYRARANREEVPVRERRAYWQEARSWFQKDLDAWIDVQKRFSMSGSNNQKMEQARKDIETCDAALSKLHI
jgi:hypothetical protein